MQLVKTSQVVQAYLLEGQAPRESAVFHHTLQKNSRFVVVERNAVQLQ